MSIVAVGLLVGAGIWSYSYARSRDDAPKYRLTRVDRGPLTAAVSATGNLNAVITVQVGSLGSILVDSGTAQNAERVLASLRQLTNRPVRYIINTHVHPDHVGGNENIRKAGQTRGAAIAQLNDRLFHDLSMAGADRRQVYE